jgi:hypothetical protein
MKPLNLDDDSFMTICTFLPLPTLAHLSQVNREMNQFIMNTTSDSCSWIWREFCQYQLKEYNNNQTVTVSEVDFDEEQKITCFMDLYKSRMFVFDQQVLDLTSSLLGFTNHGHTVENLRTMDDNKWELVRVNKPMTAGNVYYFEVVIDAMISTGGNVWMSIVGVQSDNGDPAVWKKQGVDSFGPWLTNKGVGCGLILWDGEWISNGGFRKLDNYQITRHPMTKSGDVIAFKFDMRQETMLPEATVLINGEFLMSTPYSHSSIPISDVYYPAVSLINKQRLSIYGGWTRTRELLKKNKIDITTL